MTDPAPDSAPARRTPLFDQHLALGGRMVSFAGWEMPVRYTSIPDEHRTVRERAGLFDVSHMGELLVEGPGALAFLQRMTTNDVAALEIGQAQYSLALLPTGGIVDDLLVYRRGEDRYLVCINAGRRDADWTWFSEHHGPADDCSLINASDDFAQIAIQGRAAVDIAQGLSKLPLSAVPRHSFVEGDVAGVACIAARTGYTGEDGFEFFLPVDGAVQMWTSLLEAGADQGLAPIGLGARDTLRLEAKLSLYGNDIDVTTTPYEARLGWAAKVDKGDFVGRDALLAQREAGVPRALVGFELNGRGIARHGHPVFIDGESFGEVCSGSMSPSLGTAIGLCYLPRDRSKPGTTFEIEVRKRRIPATVVKTPFYKRPY